MENSRAAHFTADAVLSGREVDFSEPHKPTDPQAHVVLLRTRATVQVQKDALVATLPVSQLVGLPLMKQVYRARSPPTHPLDRDGDCAFRPCYFLISLRPAVPSHSIGTTGRALRRTAPQAFHHVGSEG